MRELQIPRTVKGILHLAKMDIHGFSDASENTYGACLYVVTQNADKINSVQLWSNSTIVLGWIRMCPSTLKTFVVNRIAEIQTLSSQGL